MTVLEKLLVPEVASRVVEQGLDWLTGPVYQPEDLLGAAPAERVAALGLDVMPDLFGPDLDHVDVVRFATHPLMDLRIPTADPEVGRAPWPTYEHGFLRNAAPVWVLPLTRMPVSARYVRVGRDGTEREFSRYDGAAWGWRGAKGYFPPLHLIGPRGKWRGLDLPASYTEDQQALELVWVGDEGVPEGFTPARPRVHSRVVPLDECDEVFEIAIVGSWRGERVRVLQQGRDQALVVLSPTEPGRAAELGAGEVEPGVFQATVPAAELEHLEGVRSDPAPRPPGT